MSLMAALSSLTQQSTYLGAQPPFSVFSLILLELTRAPAVYRGFIIIFNCSEFTFLSYIRM